MRTEQLWQKVQELFDSLEKSQEQRVWKRANKINAHFVLDDLLNPQDHPELVNDPQFNFEDGQLSGLRSARIAVGALVKDLLASEQDEKHFAHPPHPHPRSRIYRAEPDDWNIVDTTIADVESRILALKNDCKRAPCVILDLDGTLFDVGHRTLGILRGWLLSAAAQKFSPELRRRAERIDFNHIGYSLAHAFENAGFDLRDKDVAELLNAAEKEWRRRFFDGKALVGFDQPLPGAADFARRCVANGLNLVYLSGRHHHVMHEGTREQLAKHGFPLDAVHTLLKEDSRMDDNLFKAESFARLSESFDVIGNFENEYVNVAAMAASERSPCVHVIVDSQHSGRSVPGLEQVVYRIEDFLPR